MKKLIDIDVQELIKSVSYEEFIDIFKMVLSVARSKEFNNHNFWIVTRDEKTLQGFEDFKQAQESLETWVKDYPGCRIIHFDPYFYHLKYDIGEKK